MYKFPGQSIKTKTILIFGFLTLILVFVMAPLSYISVKNIYLKQVHQHVNLLSSIVSDELDLRFLDFIDPESESAGVHHYQKQLQVTTDRLQLKNIFIFDSGGTVLVTTSQKNNQAGLLLNLEEINKLKEGQSYNSLPFKSSDGDWYLWNYRRLNDKYFLGLRESSARLAEIDTLASWFIGVGFIGIVLVLIAGWYVGRSVAGPVNRLVDFSTEIGKGNLEAFPPVGIRGELAVLQKALIQMQNDLANHQQEKERMLAQIAHELRNPLGGIALLAGLIKEELSPDSKEAEYAQRILEETEELKNQITAYLNFSKPLKPEPETIRINDLVKAIQDDLTLVLKTQNIQLRLETERETVRFDPIHLRQVLTNLIQNSARAIGENGIITIFSENEHLSVSDSGPGIPVENLDKVFEPFYTTETEGAGLGLAICRKLCQENRADISVENNLIEGCTFTITFG